jgi:predicted patatin/cPLA2 family phospholipase
MPPVAFVPATLSLDDLQTIVEVETHKREILRQEIQEIDKILNHNDIDHYERMVNLTHQNLKKQKKCSTKIYKANKEILWREMMEFRANMRLRAQGNI